MSESALALDIPGATATFDPDRIYRYTLTRTWDDSLPPMVFVMLNPSTADATCDDPTITRIRHRAMRDAYTGRRTSFGGLIVVNLFALRATDPRALRDHPDPIGPGNDEAIIGAVTRPNALVVAAWGTHGILRDRGPAVARRLDDLGLLVWCLGQTRDGHPRHPLRLSAKTRLQSYRSAP